MKILYGVQGTGNGHISRARMLARHFQYTDIDVTWLFSGRPRDNYFDMECFGDCLYRRGLTFHSEDGRVSYTKTAINNDPWAFISDVFSLDTTNYDCIVTDFEPITAWAGKRQGRKVIGLGHQYAFGHPIPRAGGNIIANSIIKLFAPATIPLGLHWHHFGSAILPPIIDPDATSQSPGRGLLAQGDKIVVYLPFENQAKVRQLLSPIEQYHFVIYSPELTDQAHEHISLRKTCLKGFKQDLATARGVICNSGFELISECLALGLPVLTKPQYGQMEQLSNAEALRTLGLASTLTELSTAAIECWLSNRPATKKIMQYPDVAKRIVEWLASGQRESAQALSQQLWRQVRLPRTHPHCRHPFRWHN